MPQTPLAGLGLLRRYMFSFPRSYTFKLSRYAPESTRYIMTPAFCKGCIFIIFSFNVLLYFNYQD